MEGFDKTNEYLKQNTELQNSLLSIFEDENAEDAIDELTKQINKENFEKLKHFLYLILHLTNNYHRKHDFINKIRQILKKLKNLQKNLLQIGIKPFIKNKLLFLLLLEEEIIVFDETIANEISNFSEEKVSDYCRFFFTEIQEFIEEKEVKKIKKERNKKYDDLDFDKERLKGENGDYICSLIREDSVEEFIKYINKEKISISITIEPSVFETNSFLIGKNPTLIEYAAFYGSIQIIRYLLKNHVEPKSSLWLHAIHSNNPAMIRLVEEKLPKPTEKECIEFLIESIKCHHNEIGEYFQGMLIENDIDYFKKESEEVERIYEAAIKYHNFKFFPNNLELNSSVFYLHKYQHNELVDTFIDELNIDDDSDVENESKVHVFFALLSQENAISKDFFENCKFLTKLAIPSTIKEIEDSSFEECKNLKEVILPASMKSINKGAFKNCRSLKQVFFIKPSELESIEDEAFYGCTMLEQIKIPNSVKSIGKNVFCECRKIRALIIPPSVESIKEGAFCKFLSLKKITIQSSITKIEPNTFQGCSSLSVVLLPSSIVSIGAYAFSECDSLKEISMPSSVESIGDHAFDKCSYLDKIKFQNDSLLTSIGPYAFNECEKLSEIKLQSSVETINEGAFFGCSSLKKVIILSAISIGVSAFRECYSLEEITIPSSVTSIGKHAFSRCVNLKEVNIESDLKSIEEYTFITCKSLTTINIPSTVKSIKDGAFTGCIALNQIDIPDSVTKIGSNVFRECRSLTKLTIPKSVKSVGENLLKNCISLKKLEIPSKLKDQIDQVDNVKIILTD